MVYPAAWGRRHREPVAGGMVPARGQAMYIFVISFLNVVLLLAPYVINQPQASFTSLEVQTISIVGNRAGVMAMGNVVALFLFAARNNVLIQVTDWSYSTYLLLHRWLGYWAIIHAIIHSFMLMAYYMAKGTYADEFIREYWSWGIVGTVAACAILPASSLWVRQRFYELFLASHVVFSLLFIIGYYYHIWYLYTYNWGYEIWIFVAGGIWGVDRVIRLGRMALQGSRTATVTAVGGEDGEYIRIDIENKLLDGGGVAYLCFPTLGWRFWETHPFSVAASSSGSFVERLPTPVSDGDSTPVPASKETSEKATGSPPPAVTESTSSGQHGTTTFFVRVRSGITKQLLAYVNRNSGPSARLRVLIDGPYHHSGRVLSQISHCSDILCIAGGVGITACLPYLRTTKNANLFWSIRKPTLASSLAFALGTLPGNVQVETTIGQRLDLHSILSLKMLSTKDADPIAIVVCGPPGMADDVRRMITEMARTNPLCRSYVFVDEAFSW
jgi:predicted ferric reductase